MVCHSLLISRARELLVHQYNCFEIEFNKKIWITHNAYVLADVVGYSKEKVFWVECGYLTNKADWYAEQLGFEFIHIPY